MILLLLGSYVADDVKTKSVVKEKAGTTQGGKNVKRAMLQKTEAR